MRPLRGLFVPEVWRVLTATVVWWWSGHALVHLLERGSCWGGRGVLTPSKRIWIASLRSIVSSSPFLWSRFISGFHIQNVGICLIANWVQKCSPLPFLRVECVSVLIKGGHEFSRIREADTLRFLKNKLKAVTNVMLTLHLQLYDCTTILRICLVGQFSK